MTGLLEKVSSYNLFNYLFPGVIFSTLVTKTTKINLVFDNLLVALFVYYFVGLIVSRFGSLVIEPFFKMIGLVKFSDYKDFVRATKKDGKIETLSEVNNTYRTLAATFVLYLILLSYIKYIANIFTVAGHSIIFSILMILMFVFSYRKQTRYISKRVEANINEPN